MNNLKTIKWTINNFLNDIIWQDSETILNGTKITGDGINQLRGYKFVLRVGEKVTCFGYRKKDMANLDPEIDNWYFVDLDDSDIHMIMTELIKNKLIGG